MIEIAIVAVALVLFVVAGYVSARRAAQTVAGYDTRSTYDPASGGYEAWYELLQREHVRVERFELRPAFLDPSVDVYVMASNTYGMFAQGQAGQSVDFITDGDWDAIASWVRNGGHLVWLADGVTGPNFVNAPDISQEGPASDTAVTVAPSALTEGVRSVSGTARLRVRYAAAQGAPPAVADDTGAVVDSYPLGKGVVTLVTDESLFENGRLDKADNARLAYNLATAGLGAHGAVAFDEWSHGYEAGATWWQILPRPFQVCAVALGCAFALLLAGAAFRFGPTARLPSETERTSAEYLSSMAMLYQRGHAVKAAIDDLTGACIRDVAAALGMAETTPARTIASRLQSAAETSEAAEAVMDIDRLRSFQSPHPADLIRAGQLCASLRKEFTRHGRIGIGRRASLARRTA